LLLPASARYSPDDIEPVIAGSKAFFALCQTRTKFPHGFVSYPQFYFARSAQVESHAAARKTYVADFDGPIGTARVCRH
jgi:hypothetical protein